MNRTEAIKAFLNKFTHPDLAALYSHNMEVQVNVGQDGGEAIKEEYKGRRWRAYQDPTTGQKWKPIRIPYNAMSEPEYEDVEMSFDLVAHAEGIGLTGWDWKEQRSRWVAFDFDALVGHSDKHARKLTPEELDSIIEVVQSVPWVTLRRSTSGKGLHLYVFLAPISTKNHTEHAALARAILGQLSNVCTFDFKSKVDTCGGNMWVWHRKMKGTNGLTLIKQGIPHIDIPHNWRDHLVVVRGERKKRIPFFIGKESEEVDIFEELSGKRTKVTLDAEHKALLDYLQEKNTQSWWDSEHHMLVTHTYHLKQAHRELTMRGVFDTVAQGREAGHDHNCFCFPMRRGAWAVRRYSQGIQESTIWEQDGQGFTRCYLNRNPDLGSVSRKFDGIEKGNGGFAFDRAEMASEAAKELGANVQIPQVFQSRQALLKPHSKDGRLIFKIKGEKEDKEARVEGWHYDRGWYERLINVKVIPPSEFETENLDDVIRHLVSESNQDMGWAVKSNQAWHVEPLSHIKPALQSMGMKPNEANVVIGASIFKPWIMVNRPFQPEYLGDRQWNRDAAQLKYLPAQDDILIYPTWQSILAHCGKGMDAVIREHAWCKANGIVSGADYLKCWIASLIKVPMEPLPYLFFFSEEENTGKSTFHEAIQLLLTRGYRRADTALKNKSDFNGELENAVVCIIEETDLRKDQLARNRIKDWVTSRLLPIHIKGRTPFDAPNTTHWIQCANDYQACPIFTGDTRITMVRVYPFEPHELIPKRQLMIQLEKEAPHFIAELLNLEIPESNDRLNLPIVITHEKQLTQDANKTLLQMFIEEKCHYVTGLCVTFSEFYENFKEWLDPNQHEYWTKMRVSKELAPDKFPRGKTSSSPYTHIGNMSFEPFKPGDEVKPRYVLSKDMKTIIREA